MSEQTMLNDNLIEFSKALASKAAVPGGGGASSVAGALGAALASMVCNLTIGKKKYAQYEGDLERILARAEELRRKLLNGVDDDARAFEPLSKAYSIPKDDPERDNIMESALKDACDAPIMIMELCCEAIALHRELAEKGSAIAISDVGVGAILCKAALTGASLNVVINVKSMRDRSYAEGLMLKLDNMLKKYGQMADETYRMVLTRIA